MTVHHGKLLMEEVGLRVSIVNEHIVDSVAVFADFHSLESEAVLHETQITILSENHFFAVAEMDSAVGTEFLIGDVVVDAIVENHAVLE